MNTTLPKQSSQELKRRGRPAGGQEIEINANDFNYITFPRRSKAS